MTSEAAVTITEMLETLPEQLKGRVVEHLREYIQDLRDEVQWNDSFGRLSIMNIHTVIDDQLFHQAVHMTGMVDNRMLLEYALRSLLQTQKTKNLEKTETTQSKFDFWERLQHFRGSVNLSELGDVDEIFSNIRDTFAKSGL